MVRIASLVPVALCLAGCADQTSIVLVVDGDLAVGSEADEIEVAMYRSGAQIWSTRDPLGPGDHLPLTYTIGRTSSGDSAVELSVSAFLRGRRELESRRESSFVTGEEVTVRICLMRECLGSEEPGCLEGACDPTGPADGDGDGDGDGEVDGDSDEGDGDGDDGGALLCSDSCPWARDGVCVDGGEGSELSLCEYGADCADCGPRRSDGCVPQCRLRQCGPDGCGGTCDPGCGPSEVCAFGGACVEWIEVHPEGPFLAGSPPSEPGHQDLEVLHEVTLTRGYAMMRREVSQQWFTSLVGINPSSYSSCGPDCPIDSVSWAISATFCNVLSVGEGLPYCYECTGTTAANYECHLASRLASPYACEGYRLPTEAEWEHAARGGTTTGTYGGDIDPERQDCESPHPVLDEIAWYCGNVPTSSPRQRGLLAANDLGLVDMLGNVFEHVHDWHSDWTADALIDPWGPVEGTDRLLRGGSFMSEAWMCRAGGRGQMDPHMRGLNVGFRVVRTLD